MHVIFFYYVVGAVAISCCAIARRVYWERSRLQVTDGEWNQLNQRLAEENIPPRFYFYA